MKMREQAKFARFLQGPRALKLRGMQSELEAVKADDPIRVEAATLLHNTMLNLALMFLLEWRAAFEADAHRQEARDRKRAADADAMRELWSSYKVTTPNGAIEFANRHLGGAYGVNDCGNSTGVTGGALAVAVKQGSRAGIWPKPSIVIVSVKTQFAEAFTKRRKLPKTLQWEADGFTSWAFDAGVTRYYAARGVDTQVSAHLGAPSGQVFAPLTKAKWIVKPGDALPKGSSTLPKPPEDLAALLSVLGSSEGKAIDQVLLG